MSAGFAAQGLGMAPGATVVSLTTTPIVWMALSNSNGTSVFYVKDSNGVNNYLSSSMSLAPTPTSFAVSSKPPA